jgi:hypothetical protein
MFQEQRKIPLVGLYARATPNMGVESAPTQGHNARVTLRDGAKKRIDGFRGLVWRRSDRVMLRQSNTHL